MSLVTESITDQIYKIIKDKILLQEIEVGEKIDTKNIAKEHDISVMPVRDALKKLASQGLVENKSRVGFFVRTFTEKEIENIMEMRSMYEVYCLKNHMNNIDKKELKSLYETINCTSEASRKKFDEIDTKFHDLLIEASSNDYLIKNYNQIKDLILLFKHLDAKRMKLANKEHCQLIESILNKNRKQAVEKLKEHINNVTYSIGEKLSG